MNQLEIIANGAVLIRNGVVHCVGPANRVENLSEARLATEVNATGKIVMPAFVEPDSNMLFDFNGNSGTAARSQMLRTCSARKLFATGLQNSIDYARYGVLTAGVSTLFAQELRVAMKLLRANKSVHARPVHLRGIVAPLFEEELSAKAGPQVAEKWLPVMKKHNLASLFEVPSHARQSPEVVEQIRAAATTAAVSGFGLRVRSDDGVPSSTLEFGYAAGASTFLGPATAPLSEFLISRPRSIFVMSTHDGMSANDGSSNQTESDPRVARKLIDNGLGIAISMGPPTVTNVTRNIQHSLYAAAKRFQLSAEETICAATINAAASLRASHLVGSLEPGKYADLILLDLPDYRELVRRPGMSSVDMAIRAGMIVHKRSGLMLD